MTKRQPWETLEAAAAALRELAALDRPSLPEGFDPLPLAERLVRLAGELRKRVDIA